MIKKAIPYLLAWVLAGCISAAAYPQSQNYYGYPNEVEYTSMKEALVSPDSVYILVLKRDNLTELPRNLYKLKNLRVLNLCANKFTSLSPDIAKLTQLEELDLSNNKLTALPDSITTLKNLKTLKLNRNELKELPANIGKLKNLTRLLIWDNPLKTLPESIGLLKNNLKTINLSMTYIMDDEVMQHLLDILPTTKIEFPQSCNCLK